MALGKAKSNGKYHNAPTTILVHGAWEDGSCWCDMISRLQAKGVVIVALQIPLSSLVDDVAAVERAIALQPGPVVLVGHSWGGTVITQAGWDSKVVGLVYIAAFAPDAGESTNDVQQHHPVPEYTAFLTQDSGGYLWFPQREVPNYFAQDIPAVNAAVLAATQGPMRARSFDEKVTHAAWHTKPSWYLVTEQDRMISPQLQQEMALRIRAHVRSVKASHVPFMSRTKETTAIVFEAIDDIISK